MIVPNSWSRAAPAAAYEDLVDLPLAVAGLHHGDVQHGDGLAGLAVGAAGAVIAAHWIDHLLFGISAHDPLTMGGAALVFLCIAAGAAILPARRAARISPLRALRSE